MRRSILGLVALSSLLLASCAEENTVDEDGIYSLTFIQGYTAMDSVRLADMGVVNGHRTLSMNVPWSGAVTLDYSGLSIAYGDTSFCANVKPNRNFVVNEALYRVSVVSDKDFDAEHLAGTELNKLFTLYTSSPLPFISNEKAKYSYDGIAVESTPFEWNYGYVPIATKLNQIYKVDARLFSQDSYITIDATPTKRDTFNFTFYFVRSTRDSVISNVKVVF